MTDNDFSLSVFFYCIKVIFLFNKIFLYLCKFENITYFNIKKMDTEDNQKKNKEYISFIGKNIRNMSFIIGAGFSKNVSKAYLSWWELLQDMVHEMFHHEILYNNFSTDDLIKKYGYLGIASEYIRRKGYHEAIDQYIEERTPVLKQNSNKTYDIVLNGKVVEKNVDVSLHKTLLGLNVKSIYTFNYDNALDVYKDLVHTSDDIKNEITNTELSDINEVIKTHDKLFDGFCEVVNASERDMCSTNTVEHVDTDVEDFKHKYNTFCEENVKYNLKSLKSFDNTSIQDVFDGNKNKLKNLKKQNEEKIKNWYDNIGDSYHLVVNSTDISINSIDKKIYKLHGSIRELDSNYKFKGEYGFDYDNHTQYIISQEDYDSYSVKHEAFVNLMRISLLKEPFCIIGFSCDDPNFMLWINWVKDIQDRLGNRSEIDNNKYYINVAGDELPSDKKMLLNNHYIKIVDLFKEYPDAKTEKDRLNAFFDSIKLIKSSPDDFDVLWDKTKIPFVIGTNKKDAIEKDLETINFAWKVIINNPLSYIADNHKYSRTAFLDNICGIINRTSWMDDDLYKLFYIALDRENVPCTAFVDENGEFYNSIKDEELKLHFKQMMMLYDIMAHGESKILGDNNDDGGHLERLRLVYNFEFKKLENNIKDWRPCYTFQKVIKVITSSDINKDDVIKLEQEAYSNMQEELFSKELLCILENKNIYKNSDVKFFIDKISSRKEQLYDEYPKLISINKLLPSILSDITPKDNISPLGIINRSITFESYDKREFAAIKVLTIMAKSGLRPDIVKIKPEDWYKVVECAYRYYPYACLYYSCFYSEKNVIKRIAQLFAYSNNKDVKNAVEKLLPKMLNVCLYDESNKIANTLYVFATEFVKLVDVSLWYKEYKDLFKKNNWLNKKDNKVHPDQYVFTIEGLRHIHDIKFKNKIIRDVLMKGDNITDWDNRLIINSYHDINELLPEEKSFLYHIMNMKYKKDNAFVILNLSSFVERKRIVKWFNNIDDKDFNDPFLVEALAFHVKKSQILRSKLYNVILENQNKIWDTGIVVEGEHIKHTEDANSFDFDNIEYNCKLDKETSKKVYCLMENSLDKIECAIKDNLKDSIFYNWSSMLVSMLCFLYRHEKDLKGEPKYEYDINRCRKMYEEASALKSPLCKLSSNKDYIVYEGCNELFKLVMACGPEKYDAEIHLLFDHLLLRDTRNIVRIFYIIEKIAKINSSYIKKYSKLLSAVVDVYSKEVEEEQWNVPACKNAVIERIGTITEILSEIEKKK